MKTLIVIPCRLDSKRLPGKPLRLIGREPLIRVIARQVLAAVGRKHEVVVATDSQQVEDAVGATAPVVRTGSQYRNGTERVAAVAGFDSFSDYSVFVSIQADQLFIPAKAILGAIALAGHRVVGTAVTPLARQSSDLANSSQVKALLEEKECVAFFRTAAGMGSQRIVLHRGVYAYQVDDLRRYACCRPTVNENIFHLEQLRAVETGVALRAVVIKDAPSWITVDTEEELREANVVYTKAGL